MVKKQLHLKVVVMEDSDSDDSMTDVMSELSSQMLKLEKASIDIEAQVKNLYARTKAETTDWLTEPLLPRPVLKKWLTERGLSDSISMDEFIDICYDAAKSLDLESRVITFHKADANVLWNGQRRMTVFDLISAIPALFH